ncbi:MAG: hypothetical protein LBF84_03395 [Holosporales bacterium]|nr:hypothetical protein [Holosporales bacterium]
MIAPKNDITAVKNAIAAYEMFDRIDVFSVDDLLKIHGIMMQDLLLDAGSFRQSGVVLFQEKEVVCVCNKKKHYSHKRQHDWSQRFERHRKDQKNICKNIVVF